MFREFGFKRAYAPQKTREEAEKPLGRIPDKQSGIHQTRASRYGVWSRVTQGGPSRLAAVTLGRQRVRETSGQSRGRIIWFISARARAISLTLSRQSFCSDIPQAETDSG